MRLMVGIAVCLVVDLLGVSAVSAKEKAVDSRPNIIYILADDIGYSDIGCYGGEIETPHLDQLAANGLRFTQFYNSGRCCPTRASLLTGLYPHQTGIGHMMEDRGLPGYRGNLKRNCVTIAEVLRTAGYKNYVAGKWHVTRDTNPKSEADKSNWPLQRGFDRFYGTIHGAGSFFDPNSLTRDNNFVSPFADAEYPVDDYYYTDAITDHAIRFVREHTKSDSDKPFFLYVAYTSAHWPMHAREKDIAKYQGKYAGGYQAIRDRRYEKMLELGVVDRSSTENWAIPENLKETDFWEWDQRNMEVYAAMIDSMDRGIGKIVASLKASNQLENTIICYLQDNGGCQEGMGRNGIGRDRLPAPSLEPLSHDYLQPDMIPKQTRDGFPMRQGKGVMAGGADTYIGYGIGWATVSNTPFRKYKHYVHEGGISTPLIVHWPNGIKKNGALIGTPGHLVDLMATAVDLAKASYPSKFHDGQEIKPMEGLSLVPAFRGESIDRKALYWEHEGNQAVRIGDYKLVAADGGKWELYDIAKDRSELTDLSASQPDIAAELTAAWNAYAKRANVVDWRELQAKQKKQAVEGSKASKFTLSQGDQLSRNEAPVVTGRDFAVTAKYQADNDGVIVAHGGSSLGWAIYLQDGKLCFVVNDRGLRQVVQSSTVALGSHSVVASCTRRGEIELRLDGEVVAKGSVAKPVSGHPIDGLQVGQDTGGAVGEYRTPFTLSGTVEKVEIILSKFKAGTTEK